MILGQSIQRFLRLPWVTLRGLVSQAAEAGVLHGGSAISFTLVS